MSNIIIVIFFGVITDRYVLIIQNVYAVTSFVKFLPVLLLSSTNRNINNIKIALTNHVNVEHIDYWQTDRIETT